MRLTSTLRFSALALMLSVMPALMGCGGNPFKPPIDDGGGGLPDNTPQNDSPQNTMTRFQSTYEYQVQAEYVKLLSKDFRYTFSIDSDPALVAQYGPNWGKDDEAESADHLFKGFTSAADGKYYPGASNIAMTLNSVQYFDDPSHPDSVAYYKWVTVARVLMSIEIPGTPDPQIYNIDARHEFYLVRGDAALLDAGQSATSDRWYIRRWDDLSTSTTAAVIRIASANSKVGNAPATVPTSWGRLKDSFLH